MDRTAAARAPRAVAAAGVLLLAVILGAGGWWALSRPQHHPQAALDRLASDLNGVVRERLTGGITTGQEREARDRLTGVARRDSGCGRVTTVVQVGTGWEMRWAQESAVATAHAGKAEFVAVDAEPAGLVGRVPQPFVSVVAGGWSC